MDIMSQQNQKRDIPPNFAKKKKYQSSIFRVLESKGHNYGSIKQNTSQSKLQILSTKEILSNEVLVINVSQLQGWD